MRQRFVGERPIRPYRSRKHEIAKALLLGQYGASAAQVKDRAWCYAKLGELRLRWDGAEGVWVNNPVNSADLEK